MSEEMQQPDEGGPVAGGVAARWLVGVVLLALIVFLAQAAALMLYVLSLREAPRTAVERQLVADETAVREHPGDIENWARLALSYASAEQWADAADTVARGRAIKPAAILDLTEADILRLKGDRAALAAYDRALASARAEHEERVKELLEDKLVKNPPPDRLVIQVMTGRALALHEFGKTEEAVEQAQEALRLDPTDADLHVALGDMLLDLGRPADAEAQYREALRYVPDLASALAGLRTIDAEKK